MSRALAIDIGGTKMEAAVVSDRGEVLGARRTATDPTDPWPALGALVESVLALEHWGRLAVCGVGCGGPMAPGGERVSPLNIAGWREFPLRARLAELTGLATFVDNDAKALALGEGWCGAAVGARNYLAMVVSTGVGGGIVVDGRLLDGEASNAGHVGHLVVVEGGRPCACGARGCLEAEASGPSIAAISGAPPERAIPAVVERTGRLVGHAIASVAVLLDLPLALVAGSVALGFGEPFFAAARAGAAERARLDYARGVRIEPAGLGDRGPVIGAAAVGWRGIGRPVLAGS